MAKENFDLLFGSTELLKHNNFIYKDIIEIVDKVSYKPSISNDKDKVLESLGLPTTSTAEYKLDTSKISTDDKEILGSNQTIQSFFSEEVKFQQWKFVENISSKLVSFDDTSVLLECLIDREKYIYEEREFKLVPLFNGYDLEVGKLFKVGIYERDNQIMIDVKDDPNLILESDFPVIDFFAKFGNMDLNKRD